MTVSRAKSCSVFSRRRTRKACAPSTMISAARGRKPVVFVSHRPNIDVLSLELVDEGELLVARANGKGEVDVLGRMRIGDAP